MTRSRFVRLGREAVLWSAAVAGVLCLLGTALSLFFGLRPLLFQSGSMAPAIETGDLSFAHRTDANSLQIGDVVSVINHDGQRVTHRLVATSGSGPTRHLVLRGDANQDVDLERYDVKTADKVLFTLPRAGYVVAWLSSPPGAYLLAAYVAVLLLLILRRPENDERTPEEVAVPDVVRASGAELEPGLDREPGVGRHPLKAVGLVTGLAVGLIVLSGWGASTWAAWTDDVDVTGTTFTTAASFGPRITACTRNTSSGNITVTWTGVAGATSYNVTVSTPSGTASGVTSPYTTTTLAKNTTGTVTVVAVRPGGNLSSASWTYDGTGANQDCHA